VPRSVRLAQGAEAWTFEELQAVREAVGGQEQDEEFTRRVIENIRRAEEKREAERQQGRNHPGRERER
jgi:hypothetical protein